MSCCRESSPRSWKHHQEVWLLLSSQGHTQQQSFSVGSDRSRWVFKNLGLRPFGMLKINTSILNGIWTSPDSQWCFYILYQAFFWGRGESVFGGRGAAQCHWLFLCTFLSFSSTSRRARKVFTASISTNVSTRMHRASLSAWTWVGSLPF